MALSSYKMAQIIADETQLDADDVHDILLGNITEPAEDVDQVMEALASLTDETLCGQNHRPGAEQGGV